MRLFGQVYNDTMVTADPYEFMQLLQHQDLISTRRKRELTGLAAVRHPPQSVKSLGQNDLDALDADFRVDGYLGIVTLGN